MCSSTLMRATTIGLANGATLDSTCRRCGSRSPRGSTSWTPTAWTIRTHITPSSNSRPSRRVERLYSIDEVKRSARIRDKVRRIDLDTVNFAFGSAEIDESEIPKLEGVAQAMQRLLKENPAETFLIEGHTDAVGSDDANLVLSDKRAESVANALTNVFAIAPENLAPQGYGEQFLKVNTQERERENRRVAIRRVTPLVAPVASAD